MTIEFHCHICNRLLRTGDERGGQTAECPGCGERITVPYADAPAAADEGPAGERDEYRPGGSEDHGSRGFEEYGRAPSAAGGGGTKTCPMCGETIQAAAVRCRFCGEDLGRLPSARRSHLKPHRGGVILAFAILGWVVCFLFGIAAWVMGNNDLQEMAAGRMDPSGEGTTKAGKIIAMVQIILLCCVLVLWCIFAMLAGVAGGF